MQTDAPWLDLALAELGVHEGPGAANNPVVLAYYRDAGHPEVRSDDVAWCAAFAGAMLSRAGLPTTSRDVSLLARSYLTYGIACDPQPGALGIWPRGASWQGHIAIVVEVDEEAGTCRAVSGNKGDAVSVDTYRLDAALGFRWPVRASVSELRRAGSTEIKAADKIEVGAALGTAAAVGTAAISAPPPAVTGPAQAPIIDPQALTMLEQIGAMAKAIGGLFTGHPWLGVALLGAGLALYMARRLKARRVARAEAGAPLSAEVVSDPLGLEVRAG